MKGEGGKEDELGTSRKNKGSRDTAGDTQVVGVVVGVDTVEGTEEGQDRVFEGVWKGSAR